MQGAQVRYKIGEIRSHIVWSKKKEKIIRKTQKETVIQYIFVLISEIIKQHKINGHKDTQNSMKQTLNMLKMQEKLEKEIVVQKFITFTLEMIGTK